MQFTETFAPLSDVDAAEAAYAALRNQRSMTLEFLQLNPLFATTLALLFHSPRVHHDTIFRLAATEGSDDIQSLIRHTPRQLSVKFGLDSLELIRTLEALARLNHTVIAGRRLHIVNSVERVRPELSRVPLPRGNGQTVYWRLSELAQDAVGRELEYLFPYQWSHIGTTCRPAYPQEKLRFAYPLCSQLGESAVALLRFYYPSALEVNRLLLAQLSGNSTTRTIGALTNNTAPWIQRHFGATASQVAELLQALRTLERALVVLGEMERKHAALA